MFTYLKNNRGNAFIEWLFILPMLVMIISFVVEIGFAMYDFSTINYAASSMAVEAAREGKFSDEIASRTGTYLTNWTSYDHEAELLRSDVPYIDPNRIVIWGPSAVSTFQRGQMITVGISYPLDFKLFYMDALAHWVIDDYKLTLKSQASAPSEVYFEPQP